MIHLLCVLSLLRLSTPDTLSIPIAGNSWTKDKTTTAWFRTTSKGTIHLQLELPGPTGSREMIISVDNHKQNLTIPANTRIIDAGQWTLADTGYHAIKLSNPPQIKTLLLTGPATTTPVAYVPNDEGNFFHWGRRGPSVHLNYLLPDSIHAEYFYNELTVPIGQDIQGSYFMADGFAEGYFGMQVNSPTERRILFSVWSPFQTDDPKNIPDSEKVILVKKGSDVHTGEFGNEGSGGQSYLNFGWKAGNTYRFLVRAKPGSQNHTIFTAWFYAPEEGHWRLIASWNWPATSAGLTHLYSFLENFDPEYGDRERSILYGRQYICDTNGHWLPLTKALFTGDNTARKGYRLDYGGGVKGNCFYLRNCGFFSDNTQLNKLLQRPLSTGDNAPAVDFTSLP